MIAIISLFLVFIVLLHRLFSWRNDESKDFFDEIPGPKGLPLVGNVQDFFLKDEQVWRNMRSRALQYFPVYKLKVFNKRMVHLLDPNDIEVVLKNPKYISKGNAYGPLKHWLDNGIITSEGDRWRKSRKVLTKCFHFGMLTTYMKSFNSEIANLIKSFSEDAEKPSDLGLHFKFHSLKVVLVALIGGDVELVNGAVKSFSYALEFLTKMTLYKELFPLIIPLYGFTPLKKKEEKAMEIYDNIASYIIEEKKSSNTTEDQYKLLGVLMENFDEKITKAELKHFVFAGNDSTSRALTFVTYVLANTPHLQDEIFEEIIHNTQNGDPTYAEIQQMNLLDRFVKEYLRMFPPVHFVGRYLAEDVPLPSGYVIPAETSIFIDIFDLHRNPNIYPEPDKFNPDRFLPENIKSRHPFSFIPFSAGPRNCIAQKFALLKLKTTICAILRKFHLKAEGSLEDIVLVPDLLLKSKSSLKVTFIPR